MLLLSLHSPVLPQGLQAEVCREGTGFVLVT